MLLIALGAAGAQAADWAIDLLYGNAEIFPSALASVTDRAFFPPRRAGQLGDPAGLVSAVVTAPHDNCVVTVTIDPTEITRISTVTVVLPQGGKVYRVAPALVLDHDRALNLKYPIAGALLNVRVEIDGRTEAKHQLVRIHAINDCLTEILVNKRGVDTGYLAAAYINEYHPALTSRLTRFALDHGYASCFDGYETGDPAAVRRQVAAIYRALHDLGFKYSSLYQSTVTTRQRSSLTASQSIRLVGDTMQSDQANCVDGTVLFASVLTQLNIRAVMFYVPHEHAYLGVYLTPRGSEADGFLVVETTVIGYHSFDDAIKIGADRLARDRKKQPREIRLASHTGQGLLRLSAAHNGLPGFYNIEVAAARALGILPLAELPVPTD